MYDVYIYIHIETFAKLCVFCGIASNLVSTQSNPSRNFARLVIVLRDVEGTTPEVRNANADQVKKELLAPSPPAIMTVEYTTTQSHRESILRLFGGYDNIAVVALPEPDGKKGLKTVDKDFQEGVVNLRNTLFDIIEAPHTYVGSDGVNVPMTGPVIADMIQTYATRLNNNPAAAFGIDTMALIENRLIERARTAAMLSLETVLSHHEATGLKDPTVAQARLQSEVDLQVLLPFNLATEWFTSAAALVSKEDIMTQVLQKVNTRIYQNNEAVSLAVRQVVSDLTGPREQVTSNLYERIRENYEQISFDHINQTLDELTTDLFCTFESEMTRVGIGVDWAIYAQNRSHLRNVFDGHRRDIRSFRTRQEDAVLKLRNRAKVLSYYERLREAAIQFAMTLSFNRNNQYAMRDVHAPHFQNMVVDGFSITDMLLTEPLPLGIEGTIQDFRDAVNALAALSHEDRPHFTNFDQDLARTQTAIYERGTYLPMPSGVEFDNIPMGHLLAYCWNLVRLHRERKDATIRMIQEISEGIEQHPDPTHGSPSTNCGSGRSPRLINATRGFVDIGYQTVAAINTPAFQSEFTNRVIQPSGLSLDQRLEIARCVCHEYGVVAKAREEWLEQVQSYEF